VSSELEYSNSVPEEEAEENEYGILLIEATHLDETRPQNASAYSAHVGCSTCLHRNCGPSRIIIKLISLSTMADFTTGSIHFHVSKDPPSVPGSPKIYPSPVLREC